jgi:hypothetical protein
MVDIVGALKHAGSGGCFDEDKIVFSALANARWTTRYVYFFQAISVCA